MSKLIELIKKNNPQDIIANTDLLNILDAKTNNSRYGLIKRAIKNNDLIRIRQGLYYLGLKHRRHELDLYTLANKIYGPSYISFETALSYYGWIPEAVYTINSASIKRSTSFTTPLGIFNYKKVCSKIFYSQVKNITNKEGDSFLIAEPVKALLDCLYIYKKKWTNFKEASEDLRIEYNHINDIDHTVLIDLAKAYQKRSVQHFINGIKKELNI